jgi:hypothetical protein
MSNQTSPADHDDALALQEILTLIEQSVADYNVIVGEVHTHHERIATERAALGALRARLDGMRKSLKGWDDRAWKMGFRDKVPREIREIRENAERRISAYACLLEELIWELFDFRERKEGSQ